ncbi:Mitogen-activated protein kinase 19 [Raphanus sativus]|uniref:mitogen-activated protein kinase n=1 Tax=Raphanus sativus TaxID=3726 RepID=A0A6J0NRR4_RAPSA|nr:mitogen-activated protein kinase 19 [Raphanus sativus]KAJ4893631.1 Mitogen-activated protein kinase 19 [Raphanus sativus]
MQQGQVVKKNMKEAEFFTEYGDANRYQILEVIGKGSYGVVCAAVDTHTGERVAIKKINDVFEHVSDALRILREVKLLRLLRHPDIVEIKSIMLPPSKREFRDIYVVFELMESDLHQVIKANDDLTREHHQFFLYQMLRALKYMHTANVYHRDLKPKNILANANCKLKVCDFGLARVSFNDTPTTVFWTDYVATRWYRAPELCGSFCSKYTPAIDIWSIGCIFAEVLLGKPLFPGKSVVHQLELITDLLGTPKAETIAGVRNEKARKYLGEMRKKSLVPFTQKFPNADPSALRLLQRLLAFDPKDRPTATEALADPYFKGLAKVEREPSCQPISKMEFEFERRRLTKDDIRELIYREILEYHPQLLKDYMNGSDGSSFLYPSAIGHLRKQFAYLEEKSGKSGPIIPPPERKHTSLPRSTVVTTSSNAPTKPLGPPPRIPSGSRPGRAVVESSLTYENSRTSYCRSTTPQQTVSPNCFFHPNAMNQQEKRGGGTEAKPQFAKPAELNPNPYVVQTQHKVGIDAKLLHAQSQYGPAGAAAVAVAAHRSVGTVGYGMS